MRNIYKDLVWLLSNHDGSFVEVNDMRRKGERTFCGDSLMNIIMARKGRDYEEIRTKYIEEWNINLCFGFITRCYDARVGKLLDDFQRQFCSSPDVIMINSALWDINRWGPDGIQMFQKNIKYLMSHLKHSIKYHRSQHETQVIWMTTPPISVEIRGGFMVKQLEFQRYSMRFNILEENQFAANVAASFGFDVLDMHYYMCNQIHRRAADGIHWNPDAVRMQINIFLTHFCLSRNIELPRNMKPLMK